MRDIFITALILLSVAAFTSNAVTPRKRMPTNAVKTTNPHPNPTIPTT